MSRRWIFVSTFSAVLMMSLVAFGQPGGGPGGRGGRMGGMMMGSGMLLRQEAVLKELSLTDAQKEKLKEALPEGRGPGGGGANFRDMSEEERAKAMEERAKQAAETEKKIADILEDKQEARLKQIRLQFIGARIVTMDEAVAKDLDITEEQKTKITETMTALRESMQGGGGGPGAFAEIMEKGNAKVLELLTDEQKAKYKEMLGEPFDVSQIQMGGGGGGRGGRGGRGN